MHISGHIALAHAHLELHAELHVFGEGRDVQFRVQDFHIGVGHDIRGCHRAFLRHGKRQMLGLVSRHTQANLFDIQDNIRNIFQHSGDGGKLMLHAGDLHSHEGCALKGRKQYPTQGIADGDPIPAFERFVGELPVHGIVGIAVAHNLFRPNEFGPVA